MRFIEIRDTETTEKAQTKLKKFITDGKFSKIITNMQLGSILQETQIIDEYLKNPHGNPFIISQIKNIEIYVDPNMNWNDTRLICDDEEILVKIPEFYI